MFYEDGINWNIKLCFFVCYFHRNSKEQYIFTENDQQTKQTVKRFQIQKSYKARQNVQTNKKLNKLKEK